VFTPDNPTRASQALRRSFCYRRVTSVGFWVEVTPPSPQSHGYIRQSNGHTGGAEQKRVAGRNVQRNELYTGICGVTSHVTRLEDDGRSNQEAGKERKRIRSRNVQRNKWVARICGLSRQRKLRFSRKFCSEREVKNGVTIAQQGTQVLRAFPGPLLRAIAGHQQNPQTSTRRATRGIPQSGLGHASGGGVASSGGAGPVGAGKPQSAASAPSPESPAPISEAMNGGVNPPLQGLNQGTKPLSPLSSARACEPTSAQPQVL
jgi:hypothetical protein